MCGIILIFYLGLAGGSGVTDTMRAVLNWLMTPGVAKLLNWKRQQGQESAHENGQCTFEKCK